MPAITASVTLRISEDLLRRVDEARLTPEAARLVGVPSNLVVSRNAWLVWAVEQALADDTRAGASAGAEALRGVEGHHMRVSPSPAGAASVRGASEPSAPAEQPEKVPETFPEAFARSVPRSAREFRPYPKGG